MATVRLSDVVIPEVWATYGEVNSPELIAFLESGIVVNDERLNQYAQGPSKTGHIPFWLDLDQTEEQDYSNDDPTDMSAPSKIGTSQMAFRKAYMSKSWSDMDLAGELIAQDPLQHIKTRTSTYWLRRLQRRIIAIAKGVLAENIANDASDMVIDISTEDGLNATAANRFNSVAFLNAAFTMGDASGGFVGIGMHSMVAKQLTVLDEIEVLKDSTGNVLTQFYKGLRVIMDDSLPVIAGGVSGYRFVSVLFGRGFIGMGVGTPDVPVETIRVPAAGNGGGMETFFERKTWLLHPIGHNWVEDGSIVEFSPTDANLADQRFWDRIYDRKQVPVAFLITN